jgi:hypothetical protein
MNRKLQFTIAERLTCWRTHRIMELCEYLTGNVLEPMLARNGAKWDRRFMNFFTFDNASDPLAPTGTIRFAVPPLFAGREGELEAAIRQETERLKIKLGPFTFERTGDAHTSIHMLIPVIENPTALMAPPDVNISQTRGCLVLRDLLGYERVNGRYEFTADDLVKRVASVTEDKIAECTASPSKASDGVRRRPSPVSMKAIRRCLDEIRQFAMWAVTHKHTKLAAL